ncbi:tyrosine-protein kinase-like otk [Carassius auratus]|uniref:Tyrosine-protein kinase-like otk n=1 Tax=Carassius auratus TaxID=7957 RepID=A0A6P6R3I2_CARAU|nr:tyrosine-protein kinase-like otk [Carassius auratus]
MAIFKILFILLALCIWCGKCDVFYKRVGEDVSMKCGVDSNSDIEWTFNGLLILSIKGKSGMRRKGTSHTASKASLNGDTLRVPKLETSDSGNYFCKQSEKQYEVYVVSVFVKPGPVLLKSSDAELHCEITGNPNTKVQWLRPPNNEEYKENNQVIQLKSVTSKEEGLWTCKVNDELKLSVTLTVVDLQSTDVNASTGDDIELPCSLPQRVSQRVLRGGWKADHLKEVSFPTLTNTNAGLHWDSKDLSRVNFTIGQLSTNFDVTLKNVQKSDEGLFVCTVEFEGGVILSAKMTLTVVEKKLSVVKGSTERKEKPPPIMESLSKKVYGLKLWIWIAVGASSLILIALIVVIGVVQRRNKRMKKRVRKLRSMRQPLTENNYCQCNSTEKEVEFGVQARPLPVPRQHRNPRTRTAGPKHTS